ncbi:MAG: Eco57I restriction-modification methylase domain-containing protein, partial [Deltaproteobacteria bacterium]|nr:Eco57I restriction-modification methylase domain-containing protein [Deltaproteobacteria bacterium]
VTFDQAVEKIHAGYEGMMIFTVQIDGIDSPTRTQLSDLTRAFNRASQSLPVVVLFQYNDFLTLATSERTKYKQTWREGEKICKISLLKDIDIQKPHTGHLKILIDLVIKPDARDFNGLYEQWMQVFDVQLLNRNFYKELSTWYFWALRHVDFPDDAEKDRDIRNPTSVIRLITRLIFCWFLREKGLIPADLFSERKLAGVLKSLKDDDSTFYRAILQNLFFGTLNQRMNIGGRENRKFTSDGSFHKRKDEYGVKNLYRYQKLFAIAEEEAVKLFSDIPFLNGGLFDCLDKEDDSGKVIYVDGFTRNARKQPKVPNFLFFSDYRTLDLSDAYGDKKRKKEKVRGLINLLDSYKFTVTENTPIEEEIALDPELLGKVFENLLASYNPETGTTARKQTGSFYTPREIVNYMVDESLIAYLEGQLKAKVPKLAEMKDLQDLLREVFAYTEKVHPFDEEEVEALIDAIDTCKIFDPACGSSAFPMGILHKLVFILGKIDPNNDRWKQKQLDKLDSVSMREELERIFENNDDDYGRKLYLIENCIYGVDIQPIAIQISKLRFFISLICDQRTNKNKAQNCGVRPLPNLETKFVAANTLISLDRGQGQLLLTDLRLPKLERELAAVRHKHFAAQRRRDKLALQRRDAVIRKKIAGILAGGGMSGEASHQLAAWDPYDQNASAPFFDPEWMYGITDGFNIAIGNPPYVRVDDISKSLKEQLKRAYIVTIGKYDLYYTFFEAGLHMLSPDGVVTYITPNKYCAADSAKCLRNAIMANDHSVEILSTSRLNVFNDAANYPVITMVAKRENSQNSYTVREALDIGDLSKSSSRSYALCKFTVDALPEMVIPINVGQADIDLVTKLLSRNKKLGNVLSVSEGLRIPTSMEKETLCKYRIVKQYQFSRWSSIERGTAITEADLLAVVSEGSDRYRKLHNEKILIAEDALEITATIDGDAYVPQGGVYFGVKTVADYDLQYILGLVNSRLLSYIYKVLYGGMHMGGGYLR